MTDPLASSSSRPGRAPLLRRRVRPADAFRCAGAGVFGLGLVLYEAREAILVLGIATTLIGISWLSMLKSASGRTKTDSLRSRQHVQVLLLASAIWISIAIVFGIADHSSDEGTLAALVPIDSHGREVGIASLATHGIAATTGVCALLFAIAFWQQRSHSPTRRRRRRTTPA